jgi:predicted nucleic-acid-binding protein
MILSTEKQLTAPHLCCSFYRLGREEIVELVESILNTPGIEIADSAMIAQALRSYGAGPMDYIDAVILVFARTAGIGTVFTYDRRHFKNSLGIDVRQPGQ